MAGEERPSPPGHLGGLVMGGRFNVRSGDGDHNWVIWDTAANGQCGSGLAEQDAQNGEWIDRAPRRRPPDRVDPRPPPHNARPARSPSSACSGGLRVPGL
jgi:hypothetical protein